ncbi:hypothetical protein WJX72_005742 [[Myrmecia] bisecta]|uniref:Uncharacterized protein n=1 Tax=[Myrmecia] bisecta TaxID=41462 RepID=A0AAW1R7B4_9CHLO
MATASLPAALAMSERQTQFVELLKALAEAVAKKVADFAAAAWTLLGRAATCTAGLVADLNRWLREQIPSGARSQTLRTQPEQFREVRRLLTQIAQDTQTSQLIVADLIQDTLTDRESVPVDLLQVQLELSVLQDGLKEYRVRAADETHKAAKQVVRRLQKDYKTIATQLSDLCRATDHFD